MGGHRTRMHVLGQARCVYGVVNTGGVHGRVCTGVYTRYRTPVYRCLLLFTAVYCHLLLFYTVFTVLHRFCIDTALTLTLTPHSRTRTVTALSIFYYFIIIL